MKINTQILKVKNYTYKNVQLMTTTNALKCIVWITLTTRKIEIVIDIELLESSAIDDGFHFILFSQAPKIKNC